MYWNGSSTQVLEMFKSKSRDRQATSSRCELWWVCHRLYNTWKDLKERVKQEQQTGILIYVAVQMKGGIWEVSSGICKQTKNAATQSEHWHIKCVSWIVWDRTHCAAMTYDMGCPERDWNDWWSPCTQEIFITETGGSHCVTTFGSLVQFISCTGTCSHRRTAIFW